LLACLLASLATARKRTRSEVAGMSKDGRVLTHGVGPHLSTTRPTARRPTAATGSLGSKWGQKPNSNGDETRLIGCGSMVRFPSHSAIDNSCCSHTGLYCSHGATAQGCSITVQQHCSQTMVSSRLMTALQTCTGWKYCCHMLEAVHGSLKSLGHDGVDELG
jgi:hypothetical protein